jgi:predicted  nucleic acid-binding Zn-ribbon protein
MTGLGTGISALLPFVYAACGAGGLAVIIKGYWDKQVQEPKSKAEAKDITAAAMDKDWSRFQREIGRLVKRAETAEDKSARADEKADRAIAGFLACEEREVHLKSRVAELEAINWGRGQIAQEAATLMAAERIVERHGRPQDGK